MGESARFFLVMTLFCLLAQGIFAMFEMATVSFNKVRLQYYVSKKMRRARWLSYLITHPAQLFGTTLIGVNSCLILGSESARRFYESLGLNPDLAPLTQIFLVMIFAELSPMLAGRRYAEHVALLFIPVLFALSRILLPLIFLLDLLCRGVGRLLGSPRQGKLYLSREELQNLIEERDESKEMTRIVGNIFTLKEKVAKELMRPLSEVQMLPAFCTVGELRRFLNLRYTPYLPLYDHRPQNIVTVVYPRDLIRLSDDTKVREHGRSVWFITETASILQILKQFRRNNQTLAIVLNTAGVATGILTLDAIIEEIFSLATSAEERKESETTARTLFIERTFPAELAVHAFNQKYLADIPCKDDEEALGEFMARHLGHIPAQGDVVRLETFELVAQEATLLGAKTILIRTLT